MTGHGLVLEQSRKFKAARSVYEHVRAKAKQLRTELESASHEWEDVAANEGVYVPMQDRSQVLNLRLHDEHLSPYFRTDMNLFHMLMVDEKTEMYIYHADNGWLFVFPDIPDGPQPFGSDGFDTR